MISGNKRRETLKWFIAGQAGHGKDAFAGFLSEIAGARHVSSSVVATADRGLPEGALRHDLPLAKGMLGGSRQPPGKVV